IQEQTLSFIPKIVAVFVAMVVFGPWMLSLMVSYTRDLFMMIPQMIH
ncbi:MAG: flagellar biosynthetic protein FliQ, partial [Firmicutes bacterium]|nr:flagellar biosynthetic protein FliQ [Bacillota bacterium]